MNPRQVLSGKCPLCGQKDFVPSRFDLWKCPSCGLIVDKKIWDPASNARCEEEWFEEIPLEQSGLAKAFQTLNNRRCFNRIKGYLPSEAAILEVGVGNGQLLNLFKEKKFQVSGCDLSKNICRYVESEFGIVMHACALKDAPAEEFDGIVMNHVAEHVDEPLEFLKEAGRRLKKNGILHLAVPNVASWESRFKGWISYEPYHLTYFTPETIRLLVKKAGFKILKTQTAEPFSDWFLTLLRTALKTQAETASARWSQKRNRKSGLETIYRLAMLAFGILILPLRCLQSLLGYGDEIIILAQPEKA